MVFKPSWHWIKHFISHSKTFPYPYDAFLQTLLPLDYYLYKDSSPYKSLKKIYIYNHTFFFQAIIFEFIYFFQVIMFNLLNILLNILVESDCLEIINLLNGEAIDSFEISFFIDEAKTRGNE